MKPSIGATAWAQAHAAAAESGLQYAAGGWVRKEIDEMRRIRKFARMMLD